MTDVYETPTDLPDHHPLAQYNGTLDDHASHVDALAQFLAEDPERVRSLMLVLTTDEPATETIPTMREDADFDQMVWYQLAAHISHVASAFEAPPEQVAKHACHVLRDQQPEETAYDGGGES